MTLREMSADYRAAARQVRLQLQQLRKAYRQEEDREKRWQLKMQIARYTEVLTQLGELAFLTEHYYERSCRPNAKYCF